MAAHFKKKYSNVYWFLIDGLRPDFLYINKNRKLKKNFIDELVERGTLFNNVVTAAGGTYTSMYSIFSSLLPSYNGASGWAKAALKKFNSEIFTIADYFQMAGYETFAYGDTDDDRTVVPKSGFNIFESSGYGNVLANTNLTKTERRDSFIEEVNACKKNKFVYHHIDILHDLNGNLGDLWPCEGYIRNISITAEEFKKLYYEYNILQDDMVIISADHGVIIERDYIKDIVENGVRHYEENVISFFSIIGRDIKAQVLENYISALDEAPTILHLALGMSMSGQGMDRYEYIKYGIYEKGMFFRETNTGPDKSDVFYIRDEKWKYVYGENDSKCEWLIDIVNDQDYQVNLKDEYPEVVKKYFQIIQRKIASSKNFEYISSLGISKDILIKKFSIILSMNKIQKQTIDSLLDLCGPYYELVVSEENVKEVYKNSFKLKIIKKQDLKRVNEICTGEWIVYIKENGGWSTFFLSDLYRYIQKLGGKCINVGNKDFTAVKKGNVGDVENSKMDAGAIRTIKYPCREPHVKNKYILFGCGKMGKEALDYLGEKSVYCFVDNNAAAVGGRINGKKIISFDMLKKIYFNHTVVISAGISYTDEIKKQLIENGINNFLFFEKEKQDIPEKIAGV